MSEQDEMHRRLVQTLGQTPRPRLPADFDQRLERKLRRPELTPSGLRILRLYVLTALLVSVWLMRSVALDWRLIVLTLVLSLAGAAIAGRRAGVVLGRRETPIPIPPRSR